jgi:hypothetical protein
MSAANDPVWLILRLQTNKIIKYKESSPATPCSGQGERGNSTYSFLTLALDGGEWSASRLGLAVPPGRVPPSVPIELEAGWASDLPGHRG